MDFEVTLTYTKVKHKKAEVVDYTQDYWAFLKDLEYPEKQWLVKLRVLND